jgi:hypothetical protein
MKSIKGNGFVSIVVAKPSMHNDITEVNRMDELTFDTIDSANESTDFKRGDVVKMYKEDTKLEYPCIVLACEELEMFRIEAMKGVLGNRSLLQDSSLYAVYISIKGQVVQIGVLPNTKLKFLLGNKVFDVFKKRVHLDNATTVEGDMLYALCMVSASDNS